MMAQAQLDSIYKNQEAFLVDTTAPIEARRALIKKGDIVLIDRILTYLKHSKSARQHPRLKRNLKQAASLRLFNKTVLDIAKTSPADQKAKLLKLKRDFLATKPHLNFLVPVILAEQFLQNEQKSENHGAGATEQVKGSTGKKLPGKQNADKKSRASAKPAKSSAAK